MKAYHLRLTKGETTSSIQRVKSKFEQLGSTYIGCERAF